MRPAGHLGPKREICGRQGLASTESTHRPRLPTRDEGLLHQCCLRSKDGVRQETTGGDRRMLDRSGNSGRRLPGRGDWSPAATCYRQASRPITASHGRGPNRTQYADRQATRQVPPGNADQDPSLRALGFVDSSDVGRLPQCCSRESSYPSGRPTRIARRPRRIIREIVERVFRCEEHSAFLW
jgi:hypothetical protein